jgi:hypothetical protein
MPESIHTRDAEAAGRWVVWALHERRKRMTAVPADTITWVAHWAFHWAIIALESTTLDTVYDEDGNHRSHDWGLIACRGCDCGSKHPDAKRPCSRILLSHPFLAR